MTAADWAQMQADLAEVRADNAVDIAIRRGNTTLASQNVRIAGAGGGGRLKSDTAIERRKGVVVLGSTSFDVQVDDRFTVAGLLYRVSLVRPNVRAAVVAEAEVIE